MVDVLATILVAYVTFDARLTVTFQNTLLRSLSRFFFFFSSLCSNEKKTLNIFSIMKPQRNMLPHMTQI